MTPDPSQLDQLGRPLRSLRVSVTDRCNLRCSYCMPEEEYTWLPRERILDYEELTSLVRAFCATGVDRVRLTGGEPLLRRGLDQFVAQLTALEGLREVALTTNGIGLSEQAQPLVAAGLTRATVSLDTLRADRFTALTRRDALDRCLAGIEAARAAGLPLKLNMVVMRGTNDDELVEMLRYAGEIGAELRFIEYMDVGGATQWDAKTVVSREDILTRLSEASGAIEAEAAGAAPAQRFTLAASGQRFGIIASTTAPFCARCDRARLTADGRLFTCLYGREGLDLRGPLRAGEDGQALARRIQRAWGVRADRGAEERLALAERAALASQDELRRDPHLEMHTRGG